jgi:hypothetical protein
VAVATGRPLWRSFVQELIEEVLLLQTDYDARNTSAMNRRGQLVRREMRRWLDDRMGALTAVLAGVVDDLRVEGRDGTGQKTEIPWIRVYSASRSPSATTGWYVVYLFSALGDRCYLSLAHGSTIWDGVEFRPRPAAETAELVNWAREGLHTAEIGRQAFVERITLETRRSPLGPAYEATTAAAIEYVLDNIPSDDRLLDDLTFMLSLLVRLYEQEARDPRVPGAPPPELQQLITDIDDASGRRAPPRRGGGQRFGLTKAEQRAVERYAVGRALSYYSSLEGWSDVRDVGDHESYDVHGRCGPDEYFIEVKGTLSRGESVILTKNEVKLHRREHPHNALFVVHSIDLDRSGPDPVASGGIEVERRPWAVEDADLTPLAYQYRL